MLESPGKRGPQLRNHLHSTSMWACLWGPSALSRLNITVGGPNHCGWCYPRAGGPSIHKNEA